MTLGNNIIGWIGWEGCIGCGVSIAMTTLPKPSQVVIHVQVDNQTICGQCAALLIDKQMLHMVSEDSKNLGWDEKHQAPNRFTHGDGLSSAVWFLVSNVSQQDVLFLLVLSSVAIFFAIPFCSNLCVSLCLVFRLFWTSAFLLPLQSSSPASLASPWGLKTFSLFYFTDLRFYATKFLSNLHLYSPLLLDKNMCLQQILFYIYSSTCL